MKVRIPIILTSLGEKGGGKWPKKDLIYQLKILNFTEILIAMFL